MGGGFDRTRSLRGLAALALASAAALLAAPPATARDDIVRSFDGEPIITSFFPASGLERGERAPTVLVGHGWGGSRETDPNSSSSAEIGSVGVGPLRRAGYNVLTWDARGFGGSGGTVQVDWRGAEGRDVKRLLGYVARQPEAKRDGPRDPRVGMSGASYGGGIQLVTAAIDRRIDAIVPDIAWHSLITSLYKARTVKAGWGSALYGLGVPTALAPGLISPAGLQSGHLDPHITSAFVSGITTGKLSREDRRWFASRGPGRLVRRIDAPTLLIQGTVDTLFTPREAMRNFRLLRRAGTPVKMIWFCGGHGLCRTDAGPPMLVQRATIKWFNRYLKRRSSVRTGPRFRWIADDGEVRKSSRFPLRPRGWVRGSGSGTLPLRPGSSSGALIGATPAPAGVDVPIVARRGGNLVGAPRLRLAYSGRAAPPRTVLYAQLVDERRDLVVGNQVTPIPVRLDGRRRSINRPLEPIAARAARGSRYSLQLAAGSNVYDPQRSAGAVSLHRIQVRIPRAR